ncbi:uncharacterized protein ARMOST_13497 [Armillaria ostoyae]|uniref:Uncharacterized protein n=1 Tax=Armillaria ostoyae TaxID=47428 RepID=A0A284RMW4_ARMOS|nr:uncharacterized protein ARMOST_13497 [Armillaria ostoyae]
MLSLPLVLLSLHALAVYSAPPLDSDDVAVLRRGGMIHGLTLRREEYHQLQKRATTICGVSARDAANGDCIKRYPSSLRKRGRSSKTKPGYYTEYSGSSSGNGESSSPSQYSDHTSSTQQRQDVQDDQAMEEYENQQALGNHCDHLVELQTVAAVLSPYCGSISARRVRNIIDYLNDPDRNLYLIRGDVNLAKGAATKRALLRARDGRSATYASRFDQSTWIALVQYLEAKESVARTTANAIQTASGLTQNVGATIHGIYTDTIMVARAMANSYVSSQQTSQQGSQGGSQGGSGGNSPHHSEGSGTSSSLSDPAAESTRMYHNRPVTVYDLDGVDHYAHWNGRDWTYVEFTRDNLRRYPPTYQQ